MPAQPYRSIFLFLFHKSTTDKFFSIYYNNNNKLKKKKKNNNTITGSNANYLMDICNNKKIYKTNKLIETVPKNWLSKKKI